MKILETLVLKLREVGPSRWPTIAIETGLAHETIRKIAYGAIKSPELATAQQLLTYFGDVKARRRKLPPLPKRKRRTNAEIKADKVKAQNRLDG